MKKSNKLKVLLFILLLVTFLTTGCTKQLSDNNKKPVKNNKTGQTLIENIICQPEDKTTIQIYEKYGVNIDKLPKCNNLKINSGGYEGLWTSLFVKPLAYFVIILGLQVKNFGLALVIVTLLIRLIIFPLTQNMAKQSELMKEAQPKLNKIQKKYQGKTDQESMMKQQTEMMAVYKEYNINPALGCIFAFIQLPLFIAFFEAIQRTPAIFEDKFLGLQLGTTPNVGIVSHTFYSYLLLMFLIGGSTIISFKMTQKDMAQTNPSMNMMPIMMSVMIIIMGLFMPSGLGIYWVASNIFTIFQNIVVQKRRKKNG